MNKTTKILIISSYNFYDGIDATSITLRNIFSGFDKKNIILIHTASHPYKTAENNVFVLYNKKFNFFQKHKNTTFAKTIKEERSIIPGVKNEYDHDITFKKKFLNKVHTYVSAYNSLLSYKYSKELDYFIQQHQPEIIYSPLGSIPIMRLVKKIAKKYDIPVIPHFMDDWIHTMYENDFWMIIPKIVKNRCLKEIFRLSKCGLAISEMMANEYTDKFNIPFYPLMNCVDIPNKENTAISTEILATKSNNLFVYCGGLHLNRWKSLLLLCDAILKFGYSERIQFCIYTKAEDWLQYGNYFSQYKFIIYKGFISNQELYKTLDRFDVLVHVESFDEQVIKYTRLSISTKIPEYLSKKKIILALGPKGIASIEYLRSNDAAIIIDDLSIEIIKEKLEDLIYSRNDEIKNNSYCLFLKNHTKENQFELLNKILTY